MIYFFYLYRTISFCNNSITFTFIISFSSCANKLKRTSSHKIQIFNIIFQFLLNYSYDFSSKLVIYTSKICWSNFMGKELQFTRITCVSGGSLSLHRECRERQDRSECFCGEGAVLLGGFSGRRSLPAREWLADASEYYAAQPVRK